MRHLTTLCLAALTPACAASYDTVTVVRFHDPSQVALTGPTPDAQLPAGASSAQTTLARGWFSPAPGARTDYEVRATRDPGGGIEAHFDTRVPIINGEHHVVLPGDGLVVLPDEARKIVPGPPFAATFQLYSCASLESAHARATLVGYRVRIGRPCTGVLSTPFTLETPWANVVEIREDRTSANGVAVAGILMSSLLFGLPGVVLYEASDKTASKTIGGALIGLSILIDVAMLPTLFGTDQSTVVYPRAVAADPRGSAW